jgi:anti-anti-sigma factor
VKISLKEESGVTILSVAGGVDTHGTEVLKAGISRLFQSGKNRIVLNLEDATEIAGEALRELAILDVFARELSGKIVLVATQPSLKESVRQFARPPVIPIASSVSQALEVFAQVTEADAADPETVLALVKRAEKAEREAAALREELARLDTRAVGELRAANEKLKAQVAILEGQVEELTRAGRTPPGGEAFLEKIAALEDSVKRLSAVDHA